MPLSGGDDRLSVIVVEAAQVVSFLDCPVSAAPAGAMVIRVLMVRERFPGCPDGGYESMLIKVGFLL